jgi:hypothetical protein
MYDVEYAAAVRRQLQSLPGMARRDLDAAVARIRQDPWQGERWRGERWRGSPPEYRSEPFGDWGLVVYLIREQAATVVLLELVWAG